MKKTDQYLSGFYEFLRKKRIGPNKIADVVGSWNEIQLLDFANDAYSLLNLPYPEASPSNFMFAANATLSGFPYPCSHIECRLRNLDSVARFTAFYADRVFVKNPFSKYVGSEGASYIADLRVVNYLKETMIGDITGLLYLRPLFDAGLLLLQKDPLAFCERHAVEIESIQRDVEKQLEKARHRLEKRFLRSVEARAWSLGEEMIRVHFSGPESLLEHGGFNIIRQAQQSLLAKYATAQGQLLSRREFLDSGLLDELIDPILNDILWQNIHIHCVRAQYLTNREADLEIITSIGSPGVIRASKALVDGLAHSVPTIESVPIEKLVQMREKEGEAFNVYRDTLYKTLRQAESLDAETIKQLVDDELRPEINKIERSIRNSRRLLASSLKTDILIGAGYIIVGMFGGFVSPELGQILTALGGYKFVSALADKAKQLTMPPMEVQQNPYYFLWKAQRMK